MTAVLVVALRARHLGLATAAVLGLVLVERATSALASPVPIASWTYKHLGVVESLQATHHVASGMDIYMNWPGMFAAGAYFSDTSGVAPIDLARWFPPLVHVLLAVGTAGLARALGARALGCAAAAGLVVAFNWVGQDYFSPQAVAICLGTGVVLLLLESRTSRACGVVALALYAAIVVTHQLTPFWLLALAGALVVLRRVPWWVAAGMALIVGAYILSRLDVAEAYGLFSGFDPIANAAGNIPAGTALGRTVGGWFAKGSCLLMWGSTFAVLARRAVRLGWKRGWRSPDVLVPAAIAFSPFMLLAGQNYGGEASMRVTLYSTLGCAAVLGPALAAAMRRRRSVAVAATVWTAVIVAVIAQSSYSLWSVTLMKQADVAAAQWVVQQHPAALVIPVIGDWPGRASVDYQRYVLPFSTLEPAVNDYVYEDLPMGRLPDLTSIPLTSSLMDQVAELHPDDQTFVVFTAGMRAYDAYYATYTPGSYDATLRALSTSPRWDVAWHRGDAWVLQYTGAGTANG
jgi:hypothetical protein